MSELSPSLSLPLVMPDQAQKHVTVNESLLRLDTLVQLSVQSRSLAVQPAAPQEGEVWILPEDASGPEWGEMAAQSLAVWRDGFWTDVTPQTGWQAWLRDETLVAVYDTRMGESRWWSAGEQAETVLATGSMGAQVRAVLLEEELTALTGASVQSGIHIPNRSVLLGVSVRISEAIIGASSFDCGIAGEVSIFGGSLGVSTGASNIGVIGPQAFYADTPIVLTANGGEFTGGSVKLAVHVLQPVAAD